MRSAATARGTALCLLALGSTLHVPTAASAAIPAPRAPLAAGASAAPDTGVRAAPGIAAPPDGAPATSIPGASAAGRLQLVGTPSAGFEGQGPAGFRVTGHTDRLRVDDDGARLRISVALATLATGVALRDRHMREKYLETDRYPDAVLELPWSALAVPADGAALDGATRAPLTLHGQTHEVPVKWRVARRGARLEVEGRADVDMRAFGITQPSYLGMSVRPDVVATVAFAAERAP